MNNKILICLFLVVFAVSYFVVWKHDTYLRNKEIKPPQAQKYRFGELCKDGLKVEYISTVRLPKSVVCQQEVGG